MSLKYKIKKFVNSNNAKNGKYYARAVMTGKIDLDGIAEEIQENCSMKKSDVYAVLTELVDVMCLHLQNSEKVRINGLGSFKLGLTTNVVDKVSDFSSDNVKKIRVNFSPEYTRITKDNRKIALVSGTKLEEYKGYRAGKNDNAK